MTETLDSPAVATDSVYARLGGAPAVRALALALPLTADAAPLAAGSVMPTLSLNDQHDKPAPVGPATRWVVFTAEKPVSDMVSAVLAAELRAAFGLPVVPANP